MLLLVRDIDRFFHLWQWSGRCDHHNRDSHRRESFGAVFSVYERYVDVESERNAVQDGRLRNRGAVGDVVKVSVVDHGQLARMTRRRTTRRWLVDDEPQLHRLFRMKSTRRSGARDDRPE